MTSPMYSSGNTTSTFMTGSSNAGLAFNTPIPLDAIARWIAANRG